MASFYAELEVTGHTYPVRVCQFSFTQATDERGRVRGKVRHGRVHLSLDTPQDDFLLLWGITAHKLLAGHVTFFETNQRTARETMSFAAGECVGYHETFDAGDSGAGAYISHLTIVAPKLVLSAGEASKPYVAAAPRGYAAPKAAVQAQIQTSKTPKQQRYEARKNLLAQARAKLLANKLASNSPLAAADEQRLQAATERLTRNNVAVERARLAGDAYENEIGIDAAGNRTIIRQKAPPEGWKVSRVIEDKKSGFMAVEYESDFEEPRRKVLSFRGTDINQMGDIVANIKQALGIKSDHYKQAEEVARAMQKSNPEGFDIAGHSLGGGEASLAGLVTGQPTYTFNAAGLHEKSMLRAGIDPDDTDRQKRLIQAYHSDRDLLSLGQDNAMVVKGALLYLLPKPLALALAPVILNPRTMPAALGERQKVAKAGLHPMAALVDGIEAQKDEDTAIIQELAGPAVPPALL